MRTSQTLSKPSIYADYNATAPASHEHAKQVMAAFASLGGNPSSQHALGRRSRVAVEQARRHVSSLLGAPPESIVFTSGATEANNLVILGILSRKHPACPDVIISQVEHASVREPLLAAASNGQCRLIQVPVQSSGKIDRATLKAALSNNTALVSILHVNNETGITQDIAALAETIKNATPTTHIHVDAVQSAGRLSLDWVGQCHSVDSVAISGHKLGSLPGIGALYVRKKSSLAPIMLGGGQEFGLRPGTENLPGIISMGIRAAEINAIGGDGLAAEQARLQHLRTSITESIKEIPGSCIHGDDYLNVGNTINFHVDGVCGSEILMNLDLANIYASSGSACASGIDRPSHVIAAMGFGDHAAKNSIRISLGARSGAEDIAFISRVLYETVNQLQILSAGQCAGAKHREMISRQMEDSRKNIN